MTNVKCEHNVPVGTICYHCELDATTATHANAHNSATHCEHGVAHERIRPCALCSSEARSAGAKRRDEVVAALTEMGIMMDAAPVPTTGRRLYDPVTNTVLKGPALSLDEIEALSESARAAGGLAVDTVFWPAHYNQGEVQCIDAAISAFGIEAVRTFAKINAFYYLWRADHKGGADDLRKANWYIRFSIGDDPRADT